MSTRAYIGKINEDGSVEAIYNHSDGYPSGLGYIAFSYINKSNIDNVLALGYVSSFEVTSNIYDKVKALQEEIKADKNSKKFNSYMIDYYNNYVEVENSELSAYSANNEDTTVKYANCGEMLDDNWYDIEYIYLLDTRTNIWKYVDMHNQFKTLRKLEDVLM